MKKAQAFIVSPVLMACLAISVLGGVAAFAYHTGQGNSTVAVATPLPTIVPTVIPSGSVSPTATPTPVPAATFKILAWNPTDGTYPGKVNKDIHMSVQYPSDCTTVAFAPAPPTSGATPNTSAEVDCQREGGTLKLRFTPPYTNADPKNPPYVMDGTAYSTDPNVHATLRSNTALSTKNGLYSKVSYNVDYSPNRRDGVQEIIGYLDYFFKNDVSGLGAASKNRGELEASAFVPTNVSDTQLAVLDSIMQTLSCIGTGCTK